MEPLEKKIKLTSTNGIGFKILVKRCVQPSSLAETPAAIAIERTKVARSVKQR